MQTAGLRSYGHQTPVLTATSHWDRLSHQQQSDSSDEEDACLPHDPRQWTRQDVATWLELVSRAHSLCDVRPDRFLMNGKALCLMSPHMFLARVPLGGKLLYKDFQLRLARAMYANNSDV